MARGHQHTFLDSYMLRRLQEQSWEEDDDDEPPLYRTDCSDVHVWAKARPHLSLDTKSQGHTLHSPASKKNARVRRSSFGQEPIPSKQPPPCEPLLEKRYRFSSIPVGASIKTSHTTTRGERSSTTATRPSSSPASTRRGFKKIRRGFPTKKSPDFSCSQASSRRSSIVGVVSRYTSKATPTSRVTANFTLPQVGQRSRGANRSREKSCNSGWTGKQYERNHTHWNMSSQNHSLRVTKTRSCGSDRVQKSASAGVVCVSKMWGVRGWRGGDEDEGEEVGRMHSVMTDTISIEDATDESVLGEGGESGGEEGEDEEEGDEEEKRKGAGFSMEDLTDLEDASSSGSSPGGEDSPDAAVDLQPEMDPVTYTLLQKAREQLQQLSVDSDSDETISSERRHGVSSRPRKPRQTMAMPNECGKRVTRSEPELATADGGFLHNKETATTCFTRKSTIPPALTWDDKTKSDTSLPSPPLTPSMFPGLEPTIHFPMLDEPYTPLPPALCGRLKWKMSTITPSIMKRCIARVGFTPCTKDCGWLGYWGKHMRSQAFRGVREHQKVNHFPGSFEIGRKDRLWRNLSKLQSRVGKKHVNFVPLTFVLPHDLRLLKREWEREESTKQKWILKPPAAARGIGVRVVHRWNQIPKRKPVIVQKYIADPYLINGSKFDLRLYVYVSSYDPLKIYMFPDGLVRFATCKYTSSSRSLSNRFIHITNYNINKKNAQFSQNPDETVCQGHKWGILALWQYMRRELAIDTDPIWESIKELVIKTIICSEPYCSSLVKTYVQNSYSCHELFGFDVMLDKRLRPWILEVNISPSLHSNSQLDVNIKGQIVRDLLNLAGFKLPHNSSSHHTTERSVYLTLTTEERQKHTHFLQRALPECERRRILDQLTADDMAVLMQSEDEFSRCGVFERIYPTAQSSRYRKYFESEKYYNILLEQWLFKYQYHPTRGIAVLKRLHSFT